MIESTTADLPRAVAGGPANASPGEPSRTIKMIRAAHRDHRYIEGSRNVDDAFVERVADRLDATLLLPIADLAESTGMLDMIVKSEADTLDIPVLDAIERVNRCLARGIASSFHRDRRVVLIQIHEAKAGLSRANAPESDEKGVARANRAIDTAYRIEPQSLREAAVLLDLIVNADREALDPPVLTALENVAACLKRLAAS